MLGTTPFENDIADVNVILSCLPTSTEVMTMAQAAPDRNGNPLVWIDNTSGVPEESLEISKVLEPKGIQFIDAPVSGGRKGAAAGSLTIMAGGSEEAMTSVRPVLEQMGQNIIHLGEKVGTGHAVKGLNNMLFASNLLLAMKGAQSLIAYGIDPDKALTAMMTSSGGSNAMGRVHEYVTNNKTIDYSFLANLLVKDVNIGLSLVPHEDDDNVWTALNKIRDTYEASARDAGWDSSQVFDAYDFIETIIRKSVAPAVVTHSHHVNAAPAALGYGHLAAAPVAAIH